MNKPVLHILLGVCLVCALQTFGQVNLVKNGSFEDTLPRNYGTHYEICEGWFNASYGTVDYITPYCHELNWLPWCAPCNFFGCQDAKDGVAYAGLVLYERLTNEINPECLQGALTQTLEENKWYELSFHLNLADSCPFKTCNLDVFFEPTQVHCSDCLPELNLRFSFDISMVENTEWHKFSVVFQSDGTENYIYFSNYMDAGDAFQCENENNLSLLMYNSAYYYIDDVRITQLSVPTIEEVELPNFFSPNLDGVNDTFVISPDSSGQKPKDVHLVIMNRWGQIMFEGNENDAWNGNDLLNEKVPDGVYFYIAKQKVGDTILTKTGFIHLVR